MREGARERERGRMKERKGKERKEKKRKEKKRKEKKRKEKKRKEKKRKEKERKGKKQDREGGTLRARIETTGDYATMPARIKLK